MPLMHCLRISHYTKQKPIHTHTHTACTHHTHHFVSHSSFQVIAQLQNKKKKSPEADPHKHLPHSFRESIQVFAGHFADCLHHRCTYLLLLVIEPVVKLHCSSEQGEKQKAVSHRDGCNNSPFWIFFLFEGYTSTVKPSK